MKRNILIIGALAFAAFGLQSCLDYDDPGSEMGAGQIIGDTEKFEGNIDRIDYRKEISEKGFDEANEKLQNYWGMSLTAQYIMRGGKEGGYPGAHAYQRQYSLGPDGYAQYFVVPHKDFMYGTLTSTYNVSDEFNGGPLGSYTDMKNQIMHVLHHPQIDSIPEMKAINLLYFCLAAQEHADLSGPFTYSEDKKNLDNPTTYDDLQTIYTGIVQNLDTIVKCLQHYEVRPDWYKEKMQTLLMGQACATSRDMITFNPTGVDSYLRLANSLKLRMAMHIVKVDPENARKWAEEAVAPENGGVVETTDQQQGLFPMASGFNHPLIDLVNNWGDLRMSASLESLLMSLHHPYVYDAGNEANNHEGYVFELNNQDIVNEKTSDVTKRGTVMCGVRTGTLVGDGQGYAQNQLQAYSKIKGAAFQQAPLYFIKLSEVCFLRAEGALRGWNMGGSAQQFYEDGIRNAYLDEPMLYEFDPSAVYKTNLDAYMNLEKPYEYVNHDYRGGTEDWPSVTKIGVKWNDGDNLETKLEKIITQKYIALFPLSTEAWTELRRTGYPKLFPVLNTDDGDGSIMQGDMIRRIPWVPTDPQVKAAVEASGIPALGDDDLQATRLWWDTPAANF